MVNTELKRWTESKNSPSKTAKAGLHKVQNRRSTPMFTACILGVVLIFMEGGEEQRKESKNKCFVAE